MSNKISWTDQTWNPVHGCTKISAGCKNCYAERMSKRLAGRYGYPDTPDNFKVTLRADRLEQPLKWRKSRRVFVCSMSDLFHEDVPEDFIWSVIEMAYELPQHTFQILTKRPARMLDVLTRSAWWNNDTPGNIWLGITVENQATADARRAAFEAVPAALKFVSYEPALGAVDWSEWEFVDWFISGGETGPGARPSHPDWHRATRDFCVANGKSYFLKQWGEWWPVDHDSTNHSDIDPSTKSCWLDIRGSSNPRYSAMMHEPEKLYRIGNARAGNLLDGVKWEQMPEVTK